MRQYPCATSVVALMTMTWTGCSTGSGAPTSRVRNLGGTGLGVVHRVGGHSPARRAAGGLGSTGARGPLPADVAAGGRTGTWARRLRCRWIRRRWAYETCDGRRCSGRAAGLRVCSGADQWSRRGSGPGGPRHGIQQFVRALARSPRPGMSQIEIVQGISRRCLWIRGRPCGGTGISHYAGCPDMGSAGRGPGLRQRHRDTEQSCRGRRHLTAALVG